MTNKEILEVLLNALACLYLNKQIETSEYFDVVRQVKEKYHG